MRIVKILPGMSCRNKSRPGFTLIELLGVLFIIGTLVGILFPTIAKVRTKAKIARAQAEIEALGVALRMYESDLGKYPPKTSASTTQDGTTSSELHDFLGTSLISHALNITVGPYMEFKSTNLSPGNAYRDPWGRGYFYVSKDETTLPANFHNTSSFDIHSLGPDGIDDTADDVKNW